MRSIVVSSVLEDMNDAYDDVCSQIDANSQGKTPIAIIFTADFQMFSIISKKLFSKYPESNIMGMTSYINFTSQNIENISVSCIVIFSGIKVSSGVVLDIATYPSKYLGVIKDALNSFDNCENMCCFEFTNSFFNCEELVQDTFHRALHKKNIPLFGCSAGAPDDMRRSLVSLNGVTYDSACVFMLIKNEMGKIYSYKENLYTSTGHVYKVTDVNCDTRTVYEFNHVKASQAMAEALHVTEDELEEKVKTHPVGQIIDDDIYITEVDKIYPDGKISYFSRIYNHTSIVQLEADDVNEVWDNTKNEILNKTKKLSFSLVVNSASRSKNFIKRDIFGEFNNYLSSYMNNFIGFSGYGEQADYKHMNQTMLVIIFE